MRNGWFPMETAPKDGDLIRGMLRDGSTVKDMHYTEDLSEKDIPPFEGWFIPIGVNHFRQVDPIAWQPKGA